MSVSKVRMVVVLFLTKFKCGNNFISRGLFKWNAVYSDNEMLAIQHRLVLDFLYL